MQYVISFNNIKDNLHWIPISIMVTDAILKFFHISLWIDPSIFGLEDCLIWLGITELICLVVFLFPKTLTPGFYLISCYWIGISFIGLIHHSFNLFPLIMQALFIVATYLKGNSKVSKLNLKI